MFEESKISGICEAYVANIYKEASAQHYEELRRTVTATHTAHKAVEEMLTKEERVKRQSKQRKKVLTQTAADLRSVPVPKIRKKKTAKVVLVQIQKKRTSPRGGCSSATVAINRGTNRRSVRWKNHTVHFVPSPITT